MPNTQSLTIAGLNLIQQALSIYDNNLQLAVSNERFREMFDLPDALVAPGASFAETIHYLTLRGEYGEVEDTECFVQARVNQARAFEPHYMERVRRNGQVISVEGAPLPQGGWVTVYTDITPIRRHEALLRARSEELSDQVLGHTEELAQANRRLASLNAALEVTKRELTEIEARTRLTAQMMPAHMAHVDAEGRYTFSNRRLSSVLPGRPNEIVGLTLLEALGEQALASIRPQLDLAYQGQASVFEFTHEASSRRIRVAFTPDEQNDERERGVYILSMDVTKETQARAVLQQTRRREMAASLTRGLAHDFSNLLTIILGMQSKLQRMDLPDEAGGLIQATLSAARRGGDLLGRIADMTTQHTTRSEPTSLPGFLHDFNMLAQSALPESIALMLNGTPPEAPLLLDRGRLQDALLNLVLNARDAIRTNDQEANGTITLTTTVLQDTWIEFAVADTGPGFSPAALDHGAEPFFTTKGSQGSGLGLAMVYDVAKLNGGEMRLRNQPEGGAVVRLRLPLRLAPQPRESALPQPGLVLLVEDNTDLRAMVRSMITALGGQVIEAGSVAEALALLTSLPEITFVLSDLSLEGEESGLDLARCLKELPSPPACALMTSLPPGNPLFDAAANGWPLLRKPFTEAQLATFLLPETKP